MVITGILQIDYIYRVIDSQNGCRVFRWTGLGIDKICFFFYLFCLSFLLKIFTHFAFQSTYFAFQPTHFAFQPTYFACLSPIFLIYWVLCQLSQPLYIVLTGSVSESVDVMNLIMIDISPILLFLLEFFTYFAQKMLISFWYLFCSKFC